MVVFGFGQAAGVVSHPVAAFVLEVCAMTAFACLLFRWLFTDAVRSLHLMMLVGIIFGLLFRSLSSFVVRLIDPNEFLVLQDRMFANFNSVRTGLLPIALAAVAVATLLIWRMRRRDVYKRQPCVCARSTWDASNDTFTPAARANWFSAWSSGPAAMAKPRSASCTAGAVCAHTAAPGQAARAAPHRMPDRAVRSTVGTGAGRTVFGVRASVIA